MKLKVLLSNGKDKLDVFLAAYKQDYYRDKRTNLFNRGQLGRGFGYLIIVVAVVWFIICLFS